MNESVFYGSLGRIIRELRLNRQMSQHYLAAEIDKTEILINEIESGRYALALGTLADIAAALGVQAKELVQAAEELGRS